MLDENDRQMKALLWMEFTYVDLSTGKSSRHPDELMQLLLSIQTGGFEHGFEGRVPIRCGRSIVITAGIRVSAHPAATRSVLEEDDTRAGL